MKKNLIICITFFLNMAVFMFCPSNLCAKINIAESKLEQASMIAFEQANSEKYLDNETEPEQIAAIQKDGGPSKAKAIVLSLLAPGAGHFYLGEKGRGEVFMGAEVVSWAGFFAFRTAAGWKEDDYIRFAEKYAGIDPSGKNDDFYRNLTFYNTTEEYNESGRIINPGSPYYYPNTGYDWYWPDDDTRGEYRDMRNSSESYYRKATFMIGVAIVNRIIASIDAIRLVKKHSQNKDATFGMIKNVKVKVKANPFGSNPNVGLTLSHRF